MLTHTLPTDDGDDGLKVSMEVVNGGCLKNPEVLTMLSSQLSYLLNYHLQDVIMLVDSFPNLFNDIPVGTYVIQHDIEVGSALPIKGGSFHFCTNFRKVNSVRNSCKTHQQLMSIILDEVPNCTIYLDDVVIHSSTWAEHMLTLHEMFRSLSSASLTLNLTKCEFA